MTDQLRALVSFVMTGGAIAQNAARELSLAGFGTGLIDDSSRLMFLPGRHSVGGPNLGNRISIEDYETVVHIAEGNTEAFLVAEPIPIESAGTGKASVGVTEIAPGTGRVRYLWLIACNVMAHGRDVQHPEAFSGAIGERNVFERWGRARSVGGGEVRPLGAGIRLVCGGSTVFFGGAELLSPVFRLAASGYMLADAFIVGLTAEGRTPLCATVACRDRGTNPLYDHVWSNRRNEPADHIFIQYPVSSTESSDFSLVGFPEPPEPVGGFLPPGHDPDELPILKIEIDDQKQSAFAYVENVIGNGGGVRAEHLVDQGTLLVHREAGVIEPNSTVIDPLRELIGELSTKRSIFGFHSLDEQKHRIRLVKQQIDSFPLAELPSPGAAFPVDCIDREEKCVYLVVSPIARDRLVPEANYEVLDPDLGVIFRFERGGPEDPPSGADLQFLARGWNFFEDPPARLIGVESASALALRQVTNIFPELLDMDVTDYRETVRIGYRFYPSEGPGLGQLRPHYVVTITFRSDVGDGDGDGVLQTASVEVPAFVDVVR